MTTIYVVIIHSEEIEFKYLADAARVATIYGEIVYFKFGKDGMLFPF